MMHSNLWSSSSVPLIPPRQLQWRIVTWQRENESNHYQREAFKRIRYIVKKRDCTVGRRNSSLQTCGLVVPEFKDAFCPYSVWPEASFVVRDVCGHFIAVAKLLAEISRRRTHCNDYDKFDDLLDAIVMMYTRIFVQSKHYEWWGIPIKVKRPMLLELTRTTNSIPFDSREFNSSAVFDS